MLQSMERVTSLAIHPGQARSLHLTSIELPPVGDEDVQVRVIRTGVCGTDRELIAGHFGKGPIGSDELVIGHELLGIIESAGKDVVGFKPGDLVVATARRGCGCPACEAGESDFCSAHGYKERGITGLHGYYTERFVESFRNLVLVPRAIERTGVLVEPLSVPHKAWRVANGVQSRIRSWNPKTAVVYGAGPIGLLATLALRARGLTVFTFDIKPAPNVSQQITEQCGATYVCTVDRSVESLKEELPSVDVIIECTGSTAPLASAMQLLGNNGVLVLLSGTGGRAERTIPADIINRQFVGGNKVMVGSVNSSLADFQAAVDDLQLFDQLWPGLAESMITHRIPGLEAAIDLERLSEGAVKAVIEISPM